jgi:hypothetical protein
MSSTGAWYRWRTRPRSRSRFVTYLLLAFDDIYDVYGSADSVFRSRYAAKVEKFFDTQRYFDDVFVELPPPGRGASFDD